MAIKLEGGGGNKALMAWPLVEASLIRVVMSLGRSQKSVPEEGGGGKIHF